jgi:hypothetical protein
MADTAAAITAPAKTAPQQTAERDDSVPRGVSAQAMMVSVFCMTFPSLVEVAGIRKSVPEQGDQDDDGNWYAQQPQK